MSTEEIFNEIWNMKYIYLFSVKYILAPTLLGNFKDK